MAQIFLFRPTQNDTINCLQGSFYLFPDFQNHFFNLVKVIKYRAFDQEDSDHVDQRAANEYTAHNDKGATNEWQRRKRSGNINMEQVMPHEGSPGITVCVDHQNTEGCLGDEIDQFGIFDMKISEGCKEKYADQNSTKLICIQYKKGQRQINNLELQLQKGATDNTHIAQKKRQQEKPEGLPKVYRPLWRMQAEEASDEVNGNEPEHFSEDDSIIEKRG